MGRHEEKVTFRTAMCRWEGNIKVDFQEGDERGMG